MEASAAVEWHRVSRQSVSEGPPFKRGRERWPPVTLRGTLATTRAVVSPFPVWCIESMKKSPEPPSRPLVPPIVLASTFAFEDAESMAHAALNPGAADLYSRWSNPTLAHVEEVLCVLEGAERALLTASGMSAIHAALMAALMSHAEPPGVLLVQHEVYGATHELVTHILAPLGIQVRRAHVDALPDVASTLPPRSVIYAELPTNPLIRLADIAAIRSAAPDDARLVVDATFASPVNVKALSLGADLVVHSATKYLGGHHDLIAGMIAGNASLMDAVWRMRKLFGPVLDPAAAYRLWRGLETLSLRVHAQNASASTLATRLAEHPGVMRVHYPSLPTHPDYDLAPRIMTGFGGVLSFELKGGARAAANVVDATQRITRAASLGGVSTLITWPAGVTHVGLSEAERDTSGVADGLLRLAVGIEEIDVLWDDLAQSLRAAQ
jgi:cystathionine beta-lyase/cystathionine gamma-synthase